MITDHLGFTGKVAIVTGGGTGIGYATALQFARLGASVVIAARTASELEAAAARIAQESGSACLAVPTDVKNEEACIALVQKTIDTFGRVDILINNAGGTRMGPLETIPTKGWDSIFDLNVKSAYILTREAGKHMIAQKSGAIVSISSGAGINGVKGGAHYSAAKSALQMFTKVTAAEWGKHGIRANCVAAGAIASERVLDAWKVAGLDMDTMSHAMPLRRTGTPDEMANMIVFFASDAASYITGQTIAVDGGPNLGGIPDA
jgi:NAD(P)-dependent dehydrogenase (short-subunit alcohol dehydrogenase family)